MIQFIQTRFPFPLGYKNNLNFTLQGPLLLTWFNFNPSMDK